MSLRVLVLGGDPGQLDYSAPNAAFRLTTTVDAWAIALNANWLGSDAPMPSRAELANYDLVIADLIPHMLPHYVRLLADRPASLRWVTLIEGSGEDYLDLLPNVQAILDASDLIATINRRTTGYFQALTKAPVAWIGIPFPRAEVAAFHTAPEARRGEILVCPRRYRQPSFVVAEALGLPVRAYFPKVSRTLSNLPTFWKSRYFSRDLHPHFWQQAEGKTPRIACLERSTADFYREAGGCRLWVNLDPRTTWARYVLDAAALQIPIISTETTDHAPVLFPETTVRDAYCIEEAIAIGERLLAEPDFAARVAREAYDRLEPYSPHACVRRLSAALNMELY